MNNGKIILREGKMTNQELKNIIVEELNQHFNFKDDVTGEYCEANTKRYEKYADNIIDKLPEQIITEDRIVEVLDSHLKYFNAAHLSNQIASEILKDNGYKILANGKIEWRELPWGINNYAVFIGDKQIENEILKLGKGKNIIVAIKEVKNDYVK
jgi:hypothetical protein